MFKLICLLTNRTSQIYYIGQALYQNDIGTFKAAQLACTLKSSALLLSTSFMAGFTVLSVVFKPLAER